MRSVPTRITWPLLLLWLGLVASAPGCCSSHHPLEGERAPDLRLLDLQGAPRQLGGFFQRETILVFWMDCVVCRAELPLLDSASRQASGGLQIVGVNSHGELPEIAALSRQLQLGFPLLLDPAKEAERAYQVVTVPTAFRIEPSGRIAEVQVGSAGYELTWKARERLWEH